MFREFTCPRDENHASSEKNKSRGATSTLCADEETDNKNAFLFLQSLRRSQL